MTASRMWNASGFLNWQIGDTLSGIDLNATANVTVPIGAVVHWLKSFTGVPATLPSGFVECNGQTISDADSPLNGVALPNLNADGGGTQYFLRGNSTSGGTGGADSHSHTIGVGGNVANTGATSAETEAGKTANSTSGLPPYYQNVAIIRIK